MKEFDWFVVKPLLESAAQILPWIFVALVFGGQEVLARRRKKLREIFLKYGGARAWQVVTIKKTLVRAHKLREQRELYKVELESQGQRSWIKVWHRRGQEFPVTTGETVTARTAPGRSDVGYFLELDAWQGVGWFDRSKKYFPPEMIELH